MPFSPDVFSKILTAVNSKMSAGGRQGLPACPICNVMNWMVADGIATTILGYGPTPFVPPGSNLPSLVLICQNCGNTVFLNLFMLGLGELVGVMPVMAR